MAIHESGYVEAPSRLVSFLQQPKDNIFWICIPKIPFDIGTVLVQHGTMAIGSPEILEIYIFGTIWRCMNEGNLKPRRDLNPFCTNPRIIFLGSESLKLPFNVNIALVQTRHHGERKPRNFGNLHCRPYMAIHEYWQFEAP